MEKTLARSLMIGFIALLPVVGAGCSQKYWLGLANFSSVQIDPGGAGLVSWTVTRDGLGEITDTAAKVTNPSVIVTLDANSAPVTFSSATVSEYQDGEGATLETVPGQSLAFVVQMQSDDRMAGPKSQTVTLDGLIPRDLVDMTDPKNETSTRLTVAKAKVTLVGRDAFGATLKQNVDLSINFSYGK